MDDFAAILVEIQPFLPNRRGGKNKGSEWGIEVLPNVGDTFAALLRLDPLIAEVDGEMARMFSPLIPNERARSSTLIEVVLRLMESFSRRRLSSPSRSRP